MKRKHNIEMGKRAVLVGASLVATALGCSSSRLDEVDPQASPVSAVQLGLTASGTLTENPLETEARTVLIAVNPNVFAGLSAELAQYQTDLSQEGWKPIVQQASVPDAVALKNYFRNAHRVVDLKAVVLVGDFPMAMCDYNWADEYGGPGACDTFLADLDGDWQDTDGDGDYDTHGNGTGDTSPEIVIGRVVSSSVTGYGKTELEMLKDYFQSNHDYRTGVTSTIEESLYSTPSAHHYNPDIDASGRMLAAQAQVYDETRVLLFDDTQASPWPGEYWLYSAPDDPSFPVASPELQRQMGLGLEWVSVSAHGWSQGWGGLMASSDVVSLVQSGGQLPVLVESLSCSTGRYMDLDSFGTTLVMGGNLAFVGPTQVTTTLVEWDVAFREALAAGGTVGDAVATFHQAALDSIGEANMVLRNYITSNVIALQGDPTLKLRLPEPAAVSATITLDSNWQSGYCVTVNVANESDDAITSWNAIINLNESTVSDLWNADYTQADSQLDASNAAHNGVIAAGASTSFGFCAAKTGASWEPAVVSASGQ